MRKIISLLLKKFGLFNLATKLWRFSKGAHQIFILNKRPDALVLFYHRVADVADDPHRLAVSPANFRAQLKCLIGHNFKFLTMAECAQKTTVNELSKKIAVITFDDGYADNLQNALPILETLNIPATIFVVAGKVDDSSPFYWDEKTKNQDQGRAMAKEELKKLATSSLIEIGSHTLTHPHLESLPEKEQEYEIQESKKRLEEIIGKPITGFSYPFGSGIKETEKKVEKAGFSYACSTIGGRVTSRSPRFALPRILMRDWDVNTFLSKITS